MIRKLEVENFMCLRNVSVELEPLTVFYGPNGSGKSALFKALVTLSKLLNGFPLRGSPRGEFSPEYGVTLDEIVWKGNSGLPIKFRVWFTDGASRPDYALELQRGRAGWSVSSETIRSGDEFIQIDEDHSFSFDSERGDQKIFTPPLQGSIRYLVHRFQADSTARPAIEPILRLSETFGQAWRYRPSASDIAASVLQDSERKTIVSENGRGVAVELQALQGAERDVFESVEKAVCSVFPHIKRIGFKTDYLGLRLLFLTDRSNEMIPGSLESDGVLLATFLFWRLYTGHKNLKVCLEEPENGLHPFLLADRFKVLKSFACAEAGRPGVQLLVSTHSPEFLSAVKAHPTALWKEIRLAEFNSETGSQIRPLKSYPDATKLLEKYREEVNEHWKTVVGTWK